MRPGNIAVTPPRTGDLPSLLGLRRPGQVRGQPDRATAGRRWLTPASWPLTRPDMARSGPQRGPVRPPRPRGLTVGMGSNTDTERAGAVPG